MNDLWFDPAKCLINGEWVAPASGQTLPLFDPSTGEEIGEIARGQGADVDAAVTAAHDAWQGAWGRVPAAELGRMLLTLSRLVTEKVDLLAWI